MAAADVSVDVSERTRTCIFAHDGQAYCHVHPLYNSSLESILSRFHSSSSSVPPFTFGSMQTERIDPLSAWLGY